MRKIALPCRAFLGKPTRFAIMLGVASAAVAAMLTATPAVAASAAPVVQHPQAVHAIVKNGRIAIPIRLTPGRHAVTMSSSVGSKPTGQATPDAGLEVNIRVGKNNCAGYTGSWSYHLANPIYGVPDVFSSQGTIWDDCGYYTHPTTAYLYFNFTAPGLPALNVTPANISAPGTAYVTKGITVNIPLPWGPGKIVADACLKWNNGWGCGPSQTLLTA